MAINGLTYYVSLNSPNFKLKDSNYEATTSITTTYTEVNLASETYLYSNYPRISLSTNVNFTRLSITNALDNVSNIINNNNYVEAQASSITVGVSIPDEYTDSGLTVTNNSGTYNVNLMDPMFKLTYNSSFYGLFIAESRSSLYTYSRYTRTGDVNRLTVNNGTSTGTVLYFTNVSSEEYATSTTSITDNFSLSTSLRTPSDTGYLFNSYADNGITSYSSTYNGNTYTLFSTTNKYSTDADGLFTYSGSSSIALYNIAGILNQNVTQNTDWTSVTSLTQTSVTRSTAGIVADENGNVVYGNIYGYGPYLTLGTSKTASRPAIITSFNKVRDASTVDTSWYGTVSINSITSNTSRTTEKYIEFNNYGVGGTITLNTYSWHTSSGTELSEATRTYSLNMNYSSVYARITITIPDAYRLTTVISDNSFPRQSETKSTISAREIYSTVALSTSASIISSEVSSVEVSNTHTNFSTRSTVGYNVEAYNNALSVTSTYTTSQFSLFTKSVTTFYEATETSSCNVTSYSNNNGYSYYTTFYGELANETFYATSWVNSAVVSSTSYKNEVGLTRYKVNEIYKTFGDIVNSTTIRDINTIGSTVFTSREMSRINSTTYNSSRTSKAVDVPVETYFTYGTTYRDATTYSSYYGPRYDYDYDYGDYSFDLDVSVTEIGSHQDSYAIDYSTSTSSVINTTAYGGTTYRLSELISSSSGNIIGNSNMTESYAYDYDVKSMFSLNDYIATLSNYTTRLRTSYTSSYDTRDEYDDYYVTKSTSLAARSTGERFIDRVEISRTFTSSYYVTYTVAMYNYSTIGTVSSSASLGYTQSEQDVSTVARTFISSTADLATTSEIASSTTATSASGSFIYSSRELVSSMTEQQNDTLIFASTFNTYSFYNSTYTTSTLNTVASTLSATTYEEWYNPISWTSTALSIATATSATETVNTTSGVVSVTQSVNYTPTYNDVDGIYVTTN